MVVEPESFCWLSGRLVPQRNGPTWLEELRRWPRLNYVVTDAGSALCKAMETLGQERASLRHSLDIFHTLREGERALRRDYGEVSRIIDSAATPQRQADRARQQGQWCASPGTKAALRWRRAEKLLDEVAARERAWREVGAALQLYTPEGHLNQRARAEAVLQQALPQLQGQHWAKTRRLLMRPQTLGFLDRLQECVAALNFSTPTLAALTTVEWLRRHPEHGQGENSVAAAVRGRDLIARVQLAKSEPRWTEKLARFRQALRDAWRASSLVEGINSVTRMQQARHRRMTQGLMDLKRLYWNMRAFRTGRRRGKSPYELLGLPMPVKSWWELLKLTPDELRQKLSAQGDGV